ncbi:uncharacterized protein LOC130099452 [Rhinichthys klamathensis goyatoka]|uniref:uncharacterized protein LOC130099452 n=1 Tax=Rhinichthys klamathensis goyatoka TaxID=3034132 RepID=UPI0024B51D86|nr:uncharacterized protein LOC130099452 [Rhinichthys klamathensis goyatoka]
MATSDRKRDRNQTNSKSKTAVTSNSVSEEHFHDYISADEDFTAIPVTPSKSPAQKKGKSEQLPTSAAVRESSDIVLQLSQLINSRSDALEKLVSDNTLRIEGLKKTIDFASAEIKDIKEKSAVLEKRIANNDARLGSAELRIADLESYSRRWDLCLFGVPEADKEDVRQEVIGICQAVLPAEKAKLPCLIDTVHRLGQKKGKELSNIDKPRGIIIQFTSRVIRDSVWKAAKRSEYLRSHGLRFAEDLSKMDRARRLQLWPAVNEARLQGKPAYFVGGRAFVAGIEINPP